MKLILKSHLEVIPKLYSTENEEDPMVYVKLFNPMGLGTWYITELDPEEEIAFGYVEFHENELGYFSIKELREINLPLGMKIERDLHFEPKRLSEIRG